MVKAILSFIFVLFAISGICDLIHTVRLFFLSPSVKFKSYIVASLMPGIAIEQLKCLSEKQRWNGEGYATKIIALTDNLSLDEINSCNEFFNNNIVLTQFKNLENLLKEISIENQRNI